jgi:hypothetical protein
MAASNVSCSTSVSRSYTLTRYYLQQPLREALRDAGTPIEIIWNKGALAAYAREHFAPGTIESSAVALLEQLGRQQPDLVTYVALDVARRLARRPGGQKAAEQARTRGAALDAELVAKFLNAQAKNSAITISSWSKNNAGRYKAVDGSGRPLSAKSLQRRLTRALKDAQALSA